MEIVKGDLLQMFNCKRFDIILHGCNCKHVMGVGLALTLQKEYPAILEHDKLNKRNPGDILPVNTVNGVIVNCYTQIYPGFSKGYNNDTSMDRYRYIKECLMKVDSKYKGKRIGVPYIGGKYGGLLKSRIKEIIRESFINNQVTLVEYDKER